MTRVSENSARHSVHYSIGRSKKKLEDLQLKGATLKEISRPSDNPIANVEALALQSRIGDNEQYIKNANYAQLHLSATESALVQLIEITSKAKELAISQSSDFFDQNTRKSVSNEVVQLRNEAMSVANRRIGQKYLFGGYKTLKKPFSESGQYLGDKGQITVEVSKDFFVPINIDGSDIFLSSSKSVIKKADPFKEISPEQAKPQKDQSDLPVAPEVNRDLASNQKTPKEEADNLFSQLDALIVGMQNNDTTLIQSLLERLDDTSSRLITQQTRVGSVYNSIDNSKSINEDDTIDARTRKSELVDADVTELYSDLAREQDVLKATYQASQGLINKSLMDFIR
jgi:flagellar hook-associated protein 3 FlgL